MVCPDQQDFICKVIAYHLEASGVLGRNLSGKVTGGMEFWKLAQAVAVVCRLMRKGMETS